MTDQHVILPDQAQRDRALDPTQSFIVQAPAGSGKTEMLIQRCLVLLTRVEQPEAIVALTFTRKAAAQMQQRIMQALRQAQTEPEPLARHAKKTWQWARKVLARDAELDWGLVNNPNRLRIKTIDALCASLTKQMPVVTQFGAQPEISDDPTPLYQAAVQACLQQMQGKADWCDALAMLCLHLDNDLNRVETLCIKMLAQRDQWLPYILEAKNHQDLRCALEKSLQHLIEDILQPLPTLTQSIESDELLTLARYAATQLRGTAPDHSICELESLCAMPSGSVEEHSVWLALANLMLTKDKTWRKQVTKAVGFPAPSSFKDSEHKSRAKNYKARMLALLSELAENDDLRQQLSRVIDAPPPRYTDQQWQIIQALLDLLPVLAAQCHIIFAKHCSVDFIAISQSALNALGEFEKPSDLALRLDYQIQHVLVDEFQDTSLTQYHLLELLTAGWQVGDGRSLFLVGDPMQSIYRFRQAEVGLFLRAQQEGLGQLPLVALVLSSNFRSDLTVVEWNNKTFSHVFPKQVDYHLGAVSYHSSETVRTDQQHTHVVCHACCDRDAEAQQVADIIRQALAIDPEQSIAILVRARSHLSAIIPVLQQQDIAYHAVELDALADREVVQDLWSLTRALLHPADRLAWFSVLRAPWCGLSLADLTVIAEQPEQTVWQRCLAVADDPKVSAIGRVFLQRFVEPMQQAITQRQRMPLSDNVTGLWLALGGPACYIDQQSLIDANAFLNFLSQHEQAGDLLDHDQFETRLMRLFAQAKPDPAARVQVMTIHKSKGLEFDTVILPALDKGSARDEASLLLWSQQPRDNGQADLVLAPIKSKAEQFDPIYRYVSQLEQAKTHHETARVLYVACTRAKHRLHLSAQLTLSDQDEIRAPSRNSFLALLWPLYQQQFTETLVVDDNAEVEQDDERAIQLRRLSLNWQARQDIPSYYHLPAGHNELDVPLAQAIESYAQVVGTFIHRILQHIAEQGIANWDLKKISSLQAQWRRALQAAGISPSQVDSALATVIKAIENTLADPKGQWILSVADGNSEYSLENHQGGKVKTHIIDRTFVDDGVRWIIDYKTAEPHQLDQQEFLTEQVQQYLPQLQRYARLLQVNSKQPVKCGLYFPLIPLFYEVKEDRLNAN